MSVYPYAMQARVVPIFFRAGGGGGGGRVG